MLKNNVKQNFTQAFFEDSHKNLWVGTNGGVFRYDRNQKKIIKFDIPKVKGQELRVMRFLEDKNKTIWVGTSAFLLKIEGKTLRTYDKTPNDI